MSPRIVSVSGLKGGCGKSTVALTLATTFYALGTRVLIVDTDPQGTLRTWATRAAELEQEGPPVVSVDGRQLRRDLPRLARDVDLVILDTPPRLGADARAAMLAADLIILPTTPGVADVWALQETLDVFGEAEAVKPELRAVAVLNRADRTGLTALARQALHELKVPLMEETLGSRVAFAEAFLQGQGVVQHAPGSPAASEARALTLSVQRELAL